MKDPTPDRCPFCGHSETRFAQISESEIYVACNYCHASGPMDITERLATKAWNRAPRPVVHRLIVQSPDTKKGD